MTGKRIIEMMEYTKPIENTPSGRLMKTMIENGSYKMSLSDKTKLCLMYYTLRACDFILKFARKERA